MAAFRRFSTPDDEQLARGRPAVVAAIAAMAALLLGGVPTPSRAALVMQVTNSTAPPGGTGSFDVTLADTGGTFKVSGFSVELSVPGASGVKFTGVTDATSSPYIFGTAQGQLSFDSFPNSQFTASDALQTAPGFVTLTSGQTVGLEHVTYSVAPGTPAGPVTVSIVTGPNTQVLDDLGNLLPFTTVNRNFNVEPAAGPEPSTLVMAGCIAAGAMAVHHRRRRRGA